MKKTIFLSLFCISLIVVMVRFGNQLLSTFLGTQTNAGIRVLSAPEGATVFIDSKEVGKTPYEDNNLSSKEYNIGVKAPDGVWQGKVKLNGGTLTIINREIFKEPTNQSGEILTLVSGSGVTVLSSPTGALVEIDGKSYGQTSTHLDLSVGEHTFGISKEGFLKRSIRAYLPESYNLILNVDLATSEVDLSQISTPVITETPKVVVKDTPTGFLRVRDKPSLAGAEITRVLVGDELTLLEELSGWDRVRLADGKEGYVSSTYVEKKKLRT